MAKTLAADLKPNPRNPRKISSEKLEMLTKSLHEFGDLGGIVFNKKTGRVVGGHQRLKVIPAHAEVIIEFAYDKPTKTGTTATGYINLDGERFSYREVEWDDVREETANIAANQHGGTWDPKLISEMLLGLEAHKVDIELMGMTKEEFEKLVNREPVEIEDEPSPGHTEGGEPKTNLGDIYLLGNHRVMCGDSTDPTAMAKLMDGDRADMIFTDPPYNVAIGMETAEQAKKRNRRTDGKIVMNDKMPDAQFRAFLTNAFRVMFDVAKPGCGIYVAHADSEGYNFRGAMFDAGWLVKQCLIWVKQSIVMGRQDYHWQHEPILYGWAKGEGHNWFGDRKQSTVWNFDKPGKSPEHPTMKPLELVEKAVLNSSAGNDVVLDSFGGSGTTLIACEKHGRRARLMELDPKYVDVIVHRWEKATDRKATKL